MWFYEWRIGEAALRRLQQVTSKYIELANSIGLHLQEYQVEVMDIQKLIFYTVNVDSYTEDQFEGENLNKFFFTPFSRLPYTLSNTEETVIPYWVRYPRTTLPPMIR
jgi:hypothetical protein